MEHELSFDSRLYWKWITFFINWSIVISSIVLMDTTVLLPIDDKIYLLNVNMIFCHQSARISSDIEFIPSTCQSSINNHLMNPQRSFREHSGRHQLPLTFPSPSLHPPLNKTTIINYFGMLLCIIDLDVVYWFYEAYMHVIDGSLRKMVTITFNLTILLLTITLAMTKQLQYWFLDFCNVIEFWILWNYSQDAGSIVSNESLCISNIINNIFGIIICIICIYCIKIEYLTISGIVSLSIAVLMDVMIMYCINSIASSFFAMNHFKHLIFYGFDHDGFIVVTNIIQSKIFNITSIYNGRHNGNDIIGHSFNSGVNVCLILQCCLI